MKRLATFLSILSLTAAGTLVAAGPASADDTVCRGTISKRTIDGDLIVPKGATCAVNSLTVKGNVQVKDGATFRSYHSTVEGNVQADGFKYVRYTYGWVEGDTLFYTPFTGGHEYHGVHLAQVWSDLCRFQVLP